MAHLEVQDLLDLAVTQDRLVVQVLLVQVVAQEVQVQVVHLGLQVLVVVQVIPDQAVLAEHEELLVLVEQLVQKETTVLTQVDGFIQVEQPLQA